jgi:MoaA/NifB/PqqE/SkfB family radical SAM enzyme
MLDNIRTLQAVRRELECSTPQLNVTVVLQRAIATQLPDTIRLAAELGVASVSVNGLEPYAPSVLDQVVWTDPERGDYMPEILTRAGEAAAETGIALRLPWMQPMLPAVCPQMHRAMVLADGAVVPCSVLTYERPSLLQVSKDGNVVRGDAVTPRVTFGSVKERSLREIWTSDEYREFRRSVSSGRFPPTCDTCLLKHGVICPTPPLAVRECLATLPEPRRT